MRSLWLCVVIFATLGVAVPAHGQVDDQTLPNTSEPRSAAFIDEASGLSLEQAIARALAEEPSLRAARKEIDVARGMRVQAGLRPNPTLTFEQREEPAGRDNLTMVSVEWPLDLFRRTGRTKVADMEVAATELTVSDRERRLAGDVRARYGAVAAAVRELAILDELVAASTRQRDLLRARVEEGASPPLELDLVDVELQRLRADQLLQVGKTEAALFELKRLLGLPPATPLVLRDTLERIVQRDAAARPFVPTPASTSTSAPTPVVEQRADVREGRARVEVANARVERAEREGRVDVAAYGTYMRMDSGFPQFGTTASGAVERVRDVFQYVAGGVRINLPIRNRNQGEVAAARAARDGAEAHTEALRLSAATEIAVARAQDERAQDAVAVYTDAARTLARQNLTVVRESYELGRSTIFDVLAEQRRYLDLERAYVSALRAAYESRTALTVATGDVR